MPIYEYRCQACGRKTSHFLRSFSDTRQPSCTHCGGHNLARLMSTFAVRRAWWSDMSDVPSPESVGDIDEDDPQSAARWLKGMRKDMGGEFGHEYDEMLDSMGSDDDGHDHDDTHMDDDF